MHLKEDTEQDQNDQGQFKLDQEKFTVTDCMFAREIPAINKIKSNKAM